MVFGIIVLVVVVIVILVAFVSHFDPSNPNSYVNSNNTSTMSGTWQSDQETPVTVDNSDPEVESQRQLSKKTEEFNAINEHIPSSESELNEPEAIQATLGAHIETLQNEILKKDIEIGKLHAKLEQFEKDQTYLRNEANRIKEAVIEEFRGGLSDLSFSLLRTIQEQLEKSENTSTAILQNISDLSSSLLQTIQKQLTESDNIYTEILQDIQDIQDRLANSKDETDSSENSSEDDETHMQIKITLDDSFPEKTPSPQETKEFLKELSKTTLHDVDAMEGTEFEEYIADLFNALGFSAKVTPKTRDFGVDVVAQNEYVRIGIQCKRSNERISLEAVQEIVAGIKSRKLDIGMVVTNNYFYSTAKELAYKTRTILWDRDMLTKKVHEIKLKQEKNDLYD